MIRTVKFSCTPTDGLSRRLTFKMGIPLPAVGGLQSCHRTLPTDNDSLTSFAEINNGQGMLANFQNSKPVAQATR